MEKQSVFCAYHPTTAVFVDDSESFLENMALQLDPKIPYKAYQKPKEALEYLQSESPAAPLSKFISREDADDVPESGTYSVQYQFSNLHKEIYNPDRFKEVSVAVIDYAMPNINGLELCRALRDTPMKTILLTGAADHAVAVQAFNEGIIDKFIFKGEKNSGKIVSDAIFELQKSYFKDRSNALLDALKVEPSSCFKDPAYCALFEKVFKETRASDCYLLEPSGSFLFMAANGAPTWLLVKSRDELQEYLAQAEEENTPEHVINALSSGAQIPFFTNFADYARAVNGAWEQYMHPASNWQGLNKYFYAILKELPYFGLANDKISCFQDYLKRVN